MLTDREGKDSTAATASESDAIRMIFSMFSMDMVVQKNLSERGGDVIRDEKSRLTYDGRRKHFCWLHDWLCMQKVLFDC